MFARYRSSFVPLACGLTFMLGAGTAAAHDEGHDSRSKEPRLSLQAAAASEVAQDTVEITLAVELEGADQADIARRLTETLNATLKDARGQAGIEARNGAYHLWSNTDRDGKITAWRGRAEVILKSTDPGAAAALAARLSDRMPISGIAFSLSPKARAAEEKRLLNEAADAFRQRADAAAEAFGFADYRIRRLDLSGSGVVYAQQRPQGMAMRASFASDAAPELEAGTATVTVTVQGEVALLNSDTATPRQ